jgi:hypothetical protein
MYDFEQAVERCFDRCNLIGESVDIYKEMNHYKVIREASSDTKEMVYEDIAYRLGFMS